MAVSKGTSKVMHVLPYWKVFNRVPEIDACFVVNPIFAKLCRCLGISEWTDVVWMGRLFARDQDFGEHWFDNWEEREAVEEQAEALGYDYEELLIVVPERFTEGPCYCIHCFDPPACNEVEHYEYLSCPKCGNRIKVGPDGPCHSDEVKKRFWMDVLDSLHMKRETILAVAKEKTDIAPEELEARFKKFDEAYSLGVLEKIDEPI